jgi:tetratricopeptide (TPR) repeat protein
VWTDKALKLVPDSYKFLKLEGNAWNGIGNIEDCEKSWLKAFLLKPDDVDLSLKLSELYKSQGRYIDCEKILLKTWSTELPKQNREIIRLKLNKIKQLINKQAN